MSKTQFALTVGHTLVIALIAIEHNREKHFPDTPSATFLLPDPLVPGYVEQGIVKLANVVDTATAVAQFQAQELAQRFEGDRAVTMSDVVDLAALDHQARADAAEQAAEQLSQDNNKLAAENEALLTELAEVRKAQTPAAADAGQAGQAEGAGSTTAAADAGQTPAAADQAVAKAATPAPAAKTASKPAAKTAGKTPAKTSGK